MRDIRVRWVLLALGLITLVALTAMNVINLVKLEETTLEASRDAQRTKVLEFTNAVFNRFSPSVRVFWPLNVEGIEERWRTTGRMPDEFMSALLDVAADSMYSAVYFAPGEYRSCENANALFRFDPETVSFQPVGKPPRMVCDGIGLLNTRLNMLIEDYRWNTKRQFDANRTHNIALINHRGQGVVGYLSYVINQDYLHRTYLPAELKSRFGDGRTTGEQVWIYDWLKGEVVATNMPDVVYDRRSIAVAQRFTDILDTWTVTATFDEGRALATSRENLIGNLVASGVATLLLFAVFLVLFIIGQRERALTLRQAGFLANVTHELKTPIAVMQAAGENLADGRVSDPERLKAYGEHIHTEAVRLRRMVDKLLDVARSESGQLMLKQRAVSLNTIVDRCLEQAESLLTQSGFEPITELEPNLPAVFADPDTLDTVLGNLVENAIKYSGESAHLAIRTKTDGPSVLLEVEDHGVGIPRHALNHVFDKFYRVEDTLTARTKGHGLGLAIVRSLTEANGGRVELESEPGRGSVFRLRFPAITPSVNATEQPTEIRTAHAQ